MIGFTNKMTFLERLQNYVFIFFMHFYMNRVVIQGQNELAKKYFNHTGKPTIQEMARNKSILLLTNSWLYQYPRPVFPNTINVGPTHIGDTKPLPEDLATWIEGAEKGVIYFSLGSNMRSASLEESKRSAILTTFAKFPQYRVIWKWEEEQLPGLPSNVICRKWLPQHDLLAHPKIKLFITQGGLQSLQESVYFEVPLIGIPFFGDQDYNVKIIKNLGIGTYMDFDSVSTEVLYNLMKEVLYNTSYMDTVKRISALSKTQMMSPRDTAVWWIEYVLKSGGNLRHLQPDHWDMPWYQYFGLDVFLVLLSPVILVLYGIYKIISRCKRKSSGEKLKKSSKWLPQQDLLAHPNIKLFITQGGLQSLQESVYFEVPLIGIPFFGDQDYNVKIIKNLGIGTYMTFDSINAENLYSNVKEILYNNSYMDTVKRISALSKTQMMSPRDTAVWWIEYVLKSGGNLRHLQPDYWDMPWYQYYGLDVFLVLLSPVILVLYGIYKIISISRRKSSGEKLKKS
ncbi:UDP-glucuronosyltransferase 2B10-like [Diaphorina citri]|uniref:UDP-glucuronosyltransferase n=1 Tax=Diaphorina citri TaxID=121845 RepID=A0A1S4EPI8_DIACI|nr:UDP-glucuronosyltransferase 2B10-like [Diaphorina citri]